MGLLPTLGWMALIFALSSRADVPHPSGISADLLAVAGHLFLYGLLALLMFNALTPLMGAPATRALSVLAFTTLYGVSDEIHQSFVPGRDAALFDVVVDAIGSAIVLGLALLALRRWGQARDQ